MERLPISQSAYLILSEGRRYGMPNEQGVRRVRDFSIKAVRQNPPSLNRGEVAVKVKIEVDPTIFDPIEIAAALTVEYAHGGQKMVLTQNVPDQPEETDDAADTA